MAPKHHPAPLSGGDRKALTKELSKSRAMTKIFAERSAEKRREGEALIREADNLSCQSWNERMWSDGAPIDPSPTIDQAINGATSRQHAFMISPCDWFAKNARRLESARLRASHAPHLGGVRQGCDADP
jgi:hypothetical protein